MRIKFSLVILIIILVGVAMFSCSEDKLEKKLEGKWKRIPTDEFGRDSLFLEYWYIDNNTITIIYQFDSTNIDTIDQATFVSKVKPQSKELTVKGFGSTIAYNNNDGLYDWRKTFYNTKWIVDKLDSKNLGMFADKDNNFIYLDFEKAD